MLLVEPDGTFARDSDGYKATQEVLVTSNLLVNAAIADPRVKKVLSGMADPEQWLERSLTAEFPRDGYVLKVSLKGAPPQAMTVVLNAVVQHYLQMTQDYPASRRAELAASLERELKRRQAEMDHLREMIRSLMKQGDKKDALALEKGQSDLNLATEIHQELSQRLARISTEAEASGPRVALLAPVQIE